MFLELLHNFKSKDQSGMLEVKLQIFLWLPCSQYCAQASQLHLATQRGSTDEVCLCASQQPAKILKEFQGWCICNNAKYNINCASSSKNKDFSLSCHEHSLHCQGRRQGGSVGSEEPSFQLQIRILKLKKHTMLSLGTLAINRRYPQ